MKKTILPLTIILALCVVIYFLVVTKEKKSFAPQKVESFLQVDSTIVDTIEFCILNTKMVFEKRDDNWFATQPDSFKVDKRLVDQLLSLTANLEVEDLISTNPIKQMLFQVDTLTGTMLNFLSQGDTVASFVVGKTSPDYMHTYVRKTDSDEVWASTGFLSRIINLRLEQWRDKSILELDPAKIETIEFIKKKGSFRLTKADTIWKVSPPPYTKSFDAKGEEVIDFLDRISQLRTDAFASLPDFEGLDFKKSLLKLKLTLDDGSEEIINIAQKSKEDNRYFVEKQGEETIFILYQGSFDYLNRDIEDFKSEN
jgi:hypothetical protein